MRSPLARSLALALGLLAALLLAACDTVQGSGRVATESRPVSGFSEVELNGSGTLYITQGEAEALTISSDDNLLPLITSEVRGDTLVLGTRSGTSVSRISELTYRLTVKDLSAVTVNGSGDIDAQQIETDSLGVRINGSGDCTASGRADQLEVRIDGSGSFDGPDLASQTATVTISGSGDVTVQVSETLDAEINGSGSIRYLGDPKVSQKISGSGSVAPR